jgi:deoxyhypusine synthase
MARGTFGARQLGRAAEILSDMVADRECVVVGTFSGAMTVAKMGLVLAEMIDRGMLQVVISTGALISHGLVEAAGLHHYRHQSDLPDDELYRLGYNRVYDSLELDTNFDRTREIIFGVLEHLACDRAVGSYELIAALGAFLHAQAPGRSFIRTAFERNVPIYVPALTDSELGLEIALFNRIRRSTGAPVLTVDPFLDLEHYAESLSSDSTLGLFTIGGGVPRNWGQQIAPYLEMVHKVCDTSMRGPRFKYGVRICPEPVHWGGLSGSTYSEAVSWGKMVPSSEGGRWAEVFSDATLAWPILLKAVIERLAKSAC